VALLKEIGQSPVLLKKEVDGFAINRIQYALLAECWRLIAVRKCCKHNHYKSTFVILTLFDFFFCTKWAEQLN